MRVLVIGVAVAVVLAAPAMGQDGGPTRIWMERDGICPKIDGASEETLKAVSMYVAEGNFGAASTELLSLSNQLNQAQRNGCKALSFPLTTTRYKDQATLCAESRPAHPATAFVACNRANWKPEE